MDQTFSETIQFTPNSNEKEILVNFKTEILPLILKETNYDELWGYQLTSTGQFYQDDITNCLIFKFLKANEFDLTKTQDQLTNTLKWRKQFKPLKAAYLETHDPKFKDIGVITYYEDLPEIITWNLYGQTSSSSASPGELFEDIDSFLRYRISLMEHSLQLCQFTSLPLSKISQVHDYKNVSFLRFDPRVKKASKVIIKTFQDYYPELLERKFFVNVPILAKWIYDLIVLTWLPTETSRKFKLLSDPTRLVHDLGTDKVPVSYGGVGKELKEQDYHFSSTGEGENKVKMTEYTKFLIENVYSLELADTVE
ncbi:hypothetical protein WICPIJ_003493 [Wickerhamomyces pijperi]|uniref:Phosphatidylinositol transfer protein SFH5 n=1 Tax=Wickerhamomyces pijperi TaxID=599730 RepID=A0A9P8TP67_WICPI|nr:hypothetical protein WICPIJ_003493 [Wickerhamomyces pijperi]